MDPTRPSRAAAEARALIHSRARLALLALALPLGLSCGADPGPEATVAAPAEPERPAWVPPPTDVALVPGASEPRVAPEVPDDTEALASRYAPRALPIPGVRAGRAAGFTFDGGKRGWFARLQEHSPMALLTPAYGHGRLYLGGGFGSTSMYALDARSGRTLFVSRADDGGPTAAIVDDDRVLFNTESCTLFVIDAETGRLRWKRWLGDPLMGQPAVGGGLVFSGYIHDGGQGWRFTALSLEDGRPRWVRPITADVMNAPVLDDDHVYLTTMDGVLWSFEQATGRVRFRKSIRATSAPWLHGDTVHVARRVVTEIDGRRRRAEQSVVLSKADGSVVREHEPVVATFLPNRPDDGGVQAGWAYEGSRPTIVDGRLYQTIGGEVHCRDAETGDLLWKRRYTERARTRPASPPAVAGSQIVFGTRDGVLYGLDVDTGMTAWAYDVGEPISAQPSVAHGWVFASTVRGGVVGLEVGDETLDGWPMWGGDGRHNGPSASAAPAEEATDGVRPTEGTLRLAGAARAGELAGFPLKGTRVSVRVSGFVARVELEQTFDNPYGRPVEAVYLFPLPDDAAVDSMRLRTGTRVVRGRIRERGEARREYRAARDRGVLASLLEQERPNLFRQSVANVRPGDEVRVVLSYTQALPYEEGSYRVVFPMVAAPRYTPAPDEDGAEDAATEGSDTRQVVLAQGERADRVRVSVEADLGVPLQSVTSPTHALDVRRTSATAASIALAGGAVAPDRDLDVRLSVASDAPAVGVMASPPRDEEAGFVSLVVHPRLDAPVDEIAMRELVFVVDTSSSMRGRPLELAQAAMRAALEGARPTDTVRVIRFSDDASELSDAPLPADAEGVARARAWVDGLRAFGATEMRRGLAAALDAPEDPQRLRIVLLLTDGFIGNEAEIFREVDGRLGQARVFALGVGSAVNRYLLTRLAEIGRGDLQVVTPGESASDAAAAFHRRIGRPYLTDVRIDWGDLAVDSVYPRRAPDLFADRPLVLHGRYAAGGRGVVTLTGRIGGRAFSRTLEVALPAAGEAGEDPRRELGSVWARTRVRDLMTAMSLRPSDDLRDEVTRLGLAHGLLTQWTSFVAVDAGYRVDADGPPTRVNQATTLPSGVDFAGAPSRVSTGGAGGVSGQGYGGGGVGEGTIGLGSLGAVGRGGGGGSGAGFGVPMSLSPRAPLVRSASAQVRGSLSREVVQRVVRAHLGEVRYAYETSLRQNPDLEGRVSVTFVIGPDGRVVAAQVASSTIADEALQQRLVAIVRRWTFPEVAGGGVVSVTYPFVFAPAPD